MTESSTLYLYLFYVSKQPSPLKDIGLKGLFPYCEQHTLRKILVQTRRSSRPSYSEPLSLSSVILISGWISFRGEGLMKNT